VFNSIASTVTGNEMYVVAKRLCMQAGNRLKQWQT